MTSEAAAPAELPAQAERLGFFVLVGLLERLTPGAARVGELGPPADEAIRFRHDATLAFSPRDVSRVQWVEPRGAGELFTRPPPVAEVTAAFLGLTGAVSPLPG